ncbi:unnamed protein product [Mucor fragilis]
MDHNDLSKQLDSFSISSDQEKITRALDKTHIASTPIFGAPSPSQQPSVYSGLMPNSHADTTSDWDPAAAAAATASSHVPPAEQDGWGEGPPSYTSISQGTYFGFNSILEAPNAMLARPPQANASTNTTAFSRFRNAPVTFASAAAEAAKNSGGDIPEINQ